MEPDDSRNFLPSSETSDCKLWGLAFLLWAEGKSPRLAADLSWKYFNWHGQIAGSFSASEWGDCWYRLLRPRAVCYGKKCIWEREDIDDRNKIKPNDFWPHVPNFSWFLDPWTPSGPLDPWTPFSTTQFLTLSYAYQCQKHKSQEDT